jgi:hypothetical protein
MKSDDLWVWFEGVVYCNLGLLSLVDIETLYGEIATIFERCMSE